MQKNADKNPLDLPVVIDTRWLRANGFGSRMTLWRKIGKGEFPAPDGKLNRCMAWKRETLVNHLKREGLA